MTVAPDDTLWAPFQVGDAEDSFHSRAQIHFATYRRLIHPAMIWGWWPELVSNELQRFYGLLVAGGRPKLVLEAPPQHGKSVAAEDFVSWLAGRAPTMKTIFASHSDQLGMARNLGIQRTMLSTTYQKIFPETKIGVDGWVLNTNLIEYAGHSGSFRNTTVAGSINGMELNFGLIDDPVKGRAEANSKVFRDKMWDWFTDDFFPRFASNSGMLFLMTRWHVDDVVGRYIKKEGQKVRVLRFPALAERDGRFRLKGEALFPEFKPLSHINERRRIMSHASFESEYQQNPIIVGGGVIPIDKLRIIPVFDRNEIAGSVRAWDKAGCQDDGAYTAGVLIHKMKDGRFLIDDVVRGQWGALEREKTIKSTCDADRIWLRKLGKGYKVIVEQEPGSGGKESAESTIRNLAGHHVIADKVTGSKEVRAEPFAAQCQGGNVWLKAGPWVENFLIEAEPWPQSRYLDQIDAAAMAFNHLTLGTQYTLAGFKDQLRW